MMLRCWAYGGWQLARHAPGLAVVVYEGVRQRREEKRSREKPKRKAVRLARVGHHRGDAVVWQIKDGA